MKLIDRIRQRVQTRKLTDTETYLELVRRVAREAEPDVADLDRLAELAESTTRNLEADIEAIQTIDRIASELAPMLRELPEADRIAAAARERYEAYRAEAEPKLESLKSESHRAISHAGMLRNDSNRIARELAALRTKHAELLGGAS